MAVVRVTNVWSMAAYCFVPRLPFDLHVARKIFFLAVFAGEEPEDIHVCLIHHRLKETSGENDFVKWVRPRR